MLFLSVILSRLKIQLGERLQTNPIAENATNRDGTVGDSLRTCSMRNGRNAAEDNRMNTRRRSQESDSQIITTEKSTPGNGEAEIKTFWKFRLRPADDEEEQDWWFASTAIPLLAATIGPLANVTSIAALVTYWRQDLIDISGEVLAPLQGIPIRDPRWAYWLNVASLICGFMGNFFLLLTFTQQIRYIVALPMTIIMWFCSTGILIGIISAMHIYHTPSYSDQGYSQGFWYAIISASLYLICSMILMINMLGYFLGHYPQHFTLTDYQRTLILQTMLFFIWLAGGGALFAHIERDLGELNWAFVDGLYFCDATILTIGYGDLVPTVDIGRGLVFPYSVIGTVMLGLIIASFTRFLSDLGENKIVKQHVEKKRTEILQEASPGSAHCEPDRTSNAYATSPRRVLIHQTNYVKLSKCEKLHRLCNKVIPTYFSRKQQTANAQSLQDERARFKEMRRLQRSSNLFRRWSALSGSVVIFVIVWAGGAVVFWQTEKGVQDMTYFRALYFCYVSLLTIGYGDLAPKSTAGRPFFVVWSLVAVPIMTILISAMSDTVIMNFKKATTYFGDLLVLPTKTAWLKWLRKGIWVLQKLLPSVQRRSNNSARKRKGATYENKSAPETDVEIGEHGETQRNDVRSIASLWRDRKIDTPIHRLATAIHRVAEDVRLRRDVEYTFEEWKEFVHLVELSVTQKSTSDKSKLRFNKEENGEELKQDKYQDDPSQWDWIGEGSPLMSNQSEAEFVLDKLCMSLLRLSKNDQYHENNNGVMIIPDH